MLRINEIFRYEAFFATKLMYVLLEKHHVIEIVLYQMLAFSNRIIMLIEVGFQSDIYAL